MKHERTIRRLILLAVLCLFSVSTRAQEGPCGLSSVVPGMTLAYPLIARAAHIEGSVIALVSFTEAGTVSAVKIIAGLQLLTSSVEQFLKSFRVNPYGGSRECPIVTSFHMTELSHVCQGDEQASETTFKVIDRQHYEADTTSFCLFITQDPASHKIRRKSFFLF